MKLSPIAILLITPDRDTDFQPSLGQTMDIDLTSKLFILLAAYTLVHAAVYLWYQHRKQAPADSQTGGTSTANGSLPRRRAGSGIHRPPTRHLIFLLASMLLAALILAGLVLFSGTPR